MKHVNVLSITLLLLLITSSCRIQSRVIGERNQKTPEVNVNTPDVLVKPLIADLDISQVKKTSIYLADLNLNLNEIKQNAQAKFIDDHNCDIIINPVYKKVTSLQNSKVSKIEYEVTGFPATIKKIEQIDTLSRTVYDYNRLKFEIPRDEFTYKDDLSVKGSELFLSLGNGNYSGIEIGYFPSISKGVWFYGSVENYKTDERALDIDLAFDDSITINKNDLNFNMTSLSVGAGYRADLTSKISTNIFGGINYGMLNLENTISEPNFPVGEYKQNGINTLGIRAGIGVDYVLFRNIQIFGKGFSNINILQISNDEISEGNDVKSTSDLSNLSILNFALGVKLRF